MPCAEPAVFAPGHALSRIVCAVSGMTPAIADWDGRRYDSVRGVKAVYSRLGHAIVILPLTLCDDGSLDRGDARSLAQVE
jgi:hypothetical protein